MEGHQVGEMGHMGNELENVMLVQQGCKDKNLGGL